MIIRSLAYFTQSQKLRRLRALSFFKTPTFAVIFLYPPCSVPYYSIWRRFLTPVRGIEGSYAPAERRRINQTLSEETSYVTPE